MNSKFHKKVFGFTLIELMIALVITAILATIAYPAYQQWVRKARRSEGINTVMNIQLAQERYRANNTTYGDLSQVWNNVTSTENGYYNLAIAGTSASGYTITATAAGAQAADTEKGTSCATLTLTVNGTTQTKTPATCWR